MNPKTDPIEKIRFDRNFNPTKHHSITDVGFSGPDGMPDNEDRRILAEIQSGLNTGLKLREANVEVSVLAGVVMLRGRVLDSRSIQAIEKQVTKIPGVKEINNQIERRE